MKYHEMFPDIEREPIVRVREAIKKGLFKKDNPIKLKQKILKELNKHLSKFYELKEPKITFIDGFPSIGQARENELILNKPSLVTYLHEFAHYKFINKSEGNSEDKARGWSISLYWLSCPKLCSSAILSGKIIHQKNMNGEELKLVEEEKNEN